MNSEVISPEKKVDELNHLAWNIRVSDSNRAFALSHEALELSGSCGYTRGKAEALRTKAFCYIRLSKNSEAQRCNEEALRLFEVLGDVGGQGYMYTGFGIIQRNQGNYKAALEYFFKSLESIKGTAYAEVEPLIYYHIGITNKYLGNLEEALEYTQRSLSAGKQINSWVTEAYTLSTLGALYEEMGEMENALASHHQSLIMRKQSGDKWGEAGSLNNIGAIYLKQGDHQKAKEYCSHSLEITRSVGDKKGEANSLFHLAEIEYAQNNFAVAREKAKQSLRIREEIGDKKGQGEIYLGMAEWQIPDYDVEEQVQQQQQLFEHALKLGRETSAQDMVAKVYRGLYQLYKEQNDYKKALIYLENFNALEKEIHSKAFNQKILSLEVTHKIEQSKKESEIYRLRNVELASLYEESKRQKEETQAALTELQALQIQLVQREKMASLGELTAGIAHEIQNPLNFVNNFSAVNIELIEELQEANKKGDKSEVQAFAESIKANEQKIAHHGKRAGTIVKGMLQHSGISAGEREQTDLNILVEQYLQLAYHSYRAKDKSFNTDLSTRYDNAIGKVNLVPQEIGRVLMNLFINAFYAVSEKKKQLIGTFEPVVSVSTIKGENHITITVRDNGTGISEKVLDKIFQPFFTTKPTGEGTGLGLSLSYDIITKGYGGNMHVTSKEGEGSEFVVQLPPK